MTQRTTKAKPAAAAKTAPAADAKTAPPAKAQTKAPPSESAIFAQAVRFVLEEKIEGGYVNDPRDPGGETNFGISKRSYPKVDIKKLTRAGAITIYRRDYWDAAACDQLPPKVAVTVFDCAVNQGVGIAKKLLQRAACVTADGIVGPKTLAAVKPADQDELVVQILGWRLRRYAFTANASIYMRGWSNRVLHLQAFLLTQLEVK